MAERGQPILSLVSRVILSDPQHIMGQLTWSGHASLLSYAIQQIEQFRSQGEDFAMQHKDSEYMGQFEEELQTAVLQAIPEKLLQRLSVEKRLQGLTVESRLQGLTVESRLQGLSPEEVLSRFTPEQMAEALRAEQAARLREILVRKQQH